MDVTTYNKFMINVPMGRDTTFLKDLTKRMGWTLQRVPSSHRPSNQLQKAIDEVKSGKLIDAVDAADVIKKCLE